MEIMSLTSISYVTAASAGSTSGYASGRHVFLLPVPHILLACVAQEARLVQGTCRLPLQICHLYLPVQNTDCIIVS